MIEYLYLALYKSFAFFLNVLPDTWLDVGIRALARFAYFASKKRRHVILTNLSICFPDMPKAEKKAIGIHSYQNLLYSIASFLKDQNLLENIRYENQHYVDEAKQRGQKIIFITAHFGVWELLSSAISKGFDVPFSVVGRELDSPVMQAHLRKGREQMGVELINKRGALKGMIKALSSGRVLGLLIDQSIPKEVGEDVLFFGTKVPQTPASSILAHKFDAVIIPIFISSEDFKHHTVTCYTPIMIDKNISKEEDLKRLNQAQATAIEKAIQENPKEWFWSHKRFKVYDAERYHDR